MNECARLRRWSSARALSLSAFFSVVFSGIIFPLVRAGRKDVLPGPIDRSPTLQRDEQGGSLLVPIVVDRVIELGAGAIDVIPADDELGLNGELSVGELRVEGVRLELDPNVAEGDGTPLSPVGELKLDPNPLGLDANPPGLDSVPDRLLGDADRLSGDPVRLEACAGERLDDTVDGIVDGSEVTLVLGTEPRLVEVPRRELPILDGICVLETVGLDRPKLGIQGGSGG